MLGVEEESHRTQLPTDISHSGRWSRCVEKIVEKPNYKKERKNEQQIQIKM